jgi:hypothetical protein
MIAWNRDHDRSESVITIVRNPQFQQDFDGVDYFGVFFRRAGARRPFRPLRKLRCGTAGRKAQPAATVT